MIIQTVVAPILVSGINDGKLTDLVTRFHFAWPVVVLAVVGAVPLLRERNPLGLGVVALAVYYGPVAALIGQSGRPDLLVFAMVAPLLATTSLVAAKRRYLSPIRQGRPILVVVGSSAIVLGLASLGGFSMMVLGDDAFGGATVAELYLSGDLPAYCHTRLSLPEQRWIELTSANPNQRTCSTDIDSIIRTIRSE